MKKRMSILPAILLILSLIACTTPTAAPTPTIPAGGEPAATMTPLAAVTEESAVVSFEDPLLEEMVRGAMGRPEGDITVAEAAAVTRLNLSNEWQRFFEETPIQDIGGLEHFTSLEYLDLSSHAVSDISPLAGLTKLTLLSLDGNPVADLTPLAGLTNLKGLNLSQSTAHDYSPLAQLVNLEFLMLENSTITDPSPLASLASLKHLYLAGSPMSDFFPLMSIYPNLVTRDFTIPSTLEELGFIKSAETNMAKYANEYLGVIIHHSEWGVPPMEWEADFVRLSMDLQDGYTLKATYHPEIEAYELGMGKDGELVMLYAYDTPTGSFTFEEGDRESAEQAVLAALNVAEGEDVLLAPINIFNDAIQSVFRMTADALYAMPFEPPTLSSLGFYPDEVSAVWRYDQRNGNDVNLEIHHPEWGALDYDFLFFTELSDEYRIVVTYHSGERKFIVKADDNDLGGAVFEYFIDTQEHIDGWCSNGDLTVEDYFLNAFNDPAIEDIYPHSIELVMQYIEGRFGMTIDELLALPPGE